MQTFGRWLRRVRDLKGFLTQESLRLAFVAGGYDAPTVIQISRWETDVVMPRREHFQALVRVLRLDTVELAEALRLFAEPKREAHLGGEAA